VDVLSARELEVLKLVAEGRPTHETAGDLVKRPRTVERHRANIMDKLGVRDRVHLTRPAPRLYTDSICAGAGAAISRRLRSMNSSTSSAASSS
jgi:DNA-binding CsgD family transcriptional regulator